MKKYLLLSLCAASVMTTQAQVVINELMQSNIDCIMDDIYEFPDSWVELYNAGDESVDLKDYKLGLTDNPAEAFSLSSYMLNAKAYKLVYCDKYDGTKSFHAPFRLESGKDGSVYLFKGDEVIDKVEKMKKQPAPNVAYGRKTDGADKWGYQLEPSPEKANTGKTCSKDDILKEPLFSEAGKVFETKTTVLLTLSLPEGTPEGTKILYTTDGSEPAIGSAVSKEFTGNALQITSSTVVRAKLFCAGYLSPRSTAQSYIFLGRKMTLPVISLVTNNSYFYGSGKLGIYTDQNKSSNKNDCRRPLNIEYFAAPDEESKINQLGETRVAGGGSRDNALKTLVLYANKRFHEKKRFSYEFFPEDRPGKTEFKSVMLRNSGNDFDYSMMRDAIMQRSFARNVDIDFQGYSPAAIYINGKYLGMLNIRERSNEDNIYTNYDKLEDLDMYENWNELKTGTSANKDAFTAFYTEPGHTMAEYELWMDIDEYINLMILEIFYNNQDFPGNNIVMWRPTAEGGRWRWIVKDTDFGLGLYGSAYDYKTFNWLYDNNYDYNRNWANQSDHTRLFRRLMADSDFKRTFTERAAIYMGDFLNVERVWELVDPMYAKVKSELAYHKEAVKQKNPYYGQWWPNYGGELNNAKTWMSKRPDFFYQHMADYYKLGTPTKLEVNLDLTETELADIEVEMNGVTLTRGKFNGKFFRNSEVRLSGKHVGAWKVVILGSDGRTEKTVEGSTCTFTMPECSSVSVNAVEFTAIEQIFDTKSTEPAIYYDLSGIRHTRIQKGQNIIRKNDGTTQKVFLPSFL